ncbi:MAG: hypothetical protein GC200_09760 [Tepidisphaera sp.]|nr:hypothetical protein [Tepidisphaera sp.]
MSHTSVIAHIVLAAAASLAAGQCDLTQVLHAPRADADHLGASLALTRDTLNSPVLVAGAPDRDQALTANAGAAYIYNFSAGFSQVQTLSPTTNANAFFGSSVSAAFPYIAVGAPGAGTAGMAYVYQKSGASWNGVLAYAPVGGASRDGFGSAVAITPLPTPRLIVGAPGVDAGGNANSGAFYVLQNSPAWALQTSKTSLDFQGAAGDLLGSSVAIDATTLAAGAPGGNSGNGYAVIGKYSAGAWTMTRFNAPVTQSPGSAFGTSVAVNQTHHLIAVGAPKFDTLESIGTYPNVGAVFLFDSSAPGAPLLIATLVPDNRTPNMEFGSEVALSDDWLLVRSLSPSMVFAFHRNPDGSFVQQSGIRNPAPSAQSGVGLALSADLAAIGDPLTSVAPNSENGAAYYTTLSAATGGDTFESALHTSVGASVTACTTSMTPLGFNVGICGNLGGQGNDVWFTFTPPCTGTVTIDTLGSDFDTVLTVHSAKPTILNTFNLACNDDIVINAQPQSRIPLPVIANTPYWVRVAGHDPIDHGNVVLNLSEVSAANDNCSVAKLVFEGSTPAGNCGATTDDPTPVFCGSNPLVFNNDVWFNFVPSQSGIYDINTCGSTLDTLLAVYDAPIFGCPLLGTGLLACNDDANRPDCEALSSAVSVPMYQGVTYAVRIGSYNPGITGNLALNITRIAPICDPDTNQDGVSDQGDVDYLINVIAGGPNPTNIDPDINHDGVADQGDIDALINVIAGAPCP